MVYACKASAGEAEMGVTLKVAGIAKTNQRAPGSKRDHDKKSGGKSLEQDKVNHL